MTLSGPRGRTCAFSQRRGGRSVAFALFPALGGGLRGAQMAGGGWAAWAGQLGLLFTHFWSYSLFLLSLFTRFLSFPLSFFSGVSVRAPYSEGTCELNSLSARGLIAVILSPFFLGSHLNACLLGCTTYSFPPSFEGFTPAVFLACAVLVGSLLSAHVPPCPRPHPSSLHLCFVKCWLQLSLQEDP